MQLEPWECGTNAASSRVECHVRRPCPSEVNTLITCTYPQVPSVLFTLPAHDSRPAEPDPAQAVQLARHPQGGAEGEQDQVIAGTTSAQQQAFWILPAPVRFITRQSASVHEGPRSTRLLHSRLRRRLFVVMWGYSEGCTGASGVGASIWTLSCCSVIECVGGDVNRITCVLAHGSRILLNVFMCTNIPRTERDVHREF